MTLADVGWYERYQAYLVAIGAYLVLGVWPRSPPPCAPPGVVAVGVVGLVVGVTKVQLVQAAPRAADDMYRQQYHGRPVPRALSTRAPVATDQLGYISLFHEGPLTDLAGLGDYAVLRAPDDVSHAELWTRLAGERGFRVVVLYDLAAVFRTPPDRGPRCGASTGHHRRREPTRSVLRHRSRGGRAAAGPPARLRGGHAALSLELNEAAGLQAMAVAEGPGRGRAAGDPAG